MSYNLLFEISGSESSVLKQSLSAIKNANLSYELLEEINDIDTKYDIIYKFTKN